MFDVEYLEVNTRMPEPCGYSALRVYLMFVGVISSGNPETQRLPQCLCAVMNFPQSSYGNSSCATYSMVKEAHRLLHEGDIECLCRSEHVFVRLTSSWCRDVLDT